MRLWAARRHVAPTRGGTRLAQARRSARSASQGARVARALPRPGLGRRRLRVVGRLGHAGGGAGARARGAAGAAAGAHDPGPPAGARRRGRRGRRRRRQRAAPRRGGRFGVRAIPGGVAPRRTVRLAKVSAARQQRQPFCAVAVWQDRDVAAAAKRGRRAGLRRRGAGKRPLDQVGCARVRLGVSMRWFVCASPVWQHAPPR